MSVCATGRLKEKEEWKNVSKRKKRTLSRHTDVAAELALLHFYFHFYLFTCRRRRSRGGGSQLLPHKGIALTGKKVADDAVADF